MKPGPKRVPLKILETRGSKLAKHRQSIFERPKRCPSPPKWLTGVALTEWKRIAPQLYRLGLLSCLDRTMLAGHCKAYADWLAASELADKSVLVKTTNGNVIQNPAVGVANRAWKRLCETGAMFGMNPADRTTVKPTEKPTAEDEKKKFFGTAG